MSVRLRIDVPSYVLVYDKKALRKVLRAAGSEVAAAARANIREAQGTGRLYYVPQGGGRYRASAPGQAPVSRTGNLAKSIKVKIARDGERVSIVDAAYYALFLESGATGGAGSGKLGKRGKRNKRGGVAGSRLLKPRPFLSVALAGRESSIADRVRAAVMDGVAFKRMK